MGGPVSLVFRLYAPGISPGASINLVGNEPTLAAWNPEKGRKMSAVAHGWFEAVVHIPFGFPSIYQYKYVIDYGNGAYQWEQTPNRTGSVSGKTSYLVDYFEQIGGLADEEDATSEVRVMSFNIRFENEYDGVHNWKFRKEYVAKVIELWSPLVVGLQEVLHGQLMYLAEKLSNSYSYVGVGRDDGFQAGEYSPIFYNYTKLDILDSGTFWLSETHWTAGSRSWDSACVRICTWGKFRLKDSHNSLPFFVFNTHLDHRSPKARLEGLKLITNMFYAWTRFCPGFITGDFNEEPREPALANVLNPDTAFPTIMKDSQADPEVPATGPTFTFNNWDCKSGLFWIDYILVKPDMRVARFEVIDHTEEGRTISDHFPIVADVLLNLSA